MTIRWPIDVLTPQGLAVDIAPRSLSAPPSISGAVQVVSSDAGIWRLTLDAIPVLHDQQVKAWRGIDNLLEGRLRPIVVPITRAFQPGWGVNDALTFPVEHSDGTPFADGVGYVGQTMDVRLAGSVAVRATTASVTIAYGGEIEPSQHFSIGERLYRVRTIIYTSATAATINFRPPLREAASAGARLEFDDPCVRVKLATDDAMSLPLEANMRAFPSISFVEDV